MNKKLALRKAHRYIGLFISIQLLLWTIGGIYFSWTDIDEIHGDHLRSSNSSKLEFKISANKALEHLPENSQLLSLTSGHLANSTIYKMKYTMANNKVVTRIIDAQSNKIIKDISKQLAIDIAKNNTSFEAEVESIELLSETGSHHEYRGKALPAWAVTFDHSSSPTFYINAQTGKLESVRHTSWRIFDFLWMLHTMDYQARDDFGNWLLKIFSIIALITSISGIILFIISSRRRKAQ